MVSMYTFYCIILEIKTDQMYQGTCNFPMWTYYTKQKVSYIWTMPSQGHLYLMDMTLQCHDFICSSDKAINININILTFNY